jgi:selenide,water dikinase
VLRPIGEMFDQQSYPDLLVGLNSPDDAAVWKLDEQRGLVLTTDFFTPVVDDPLDYGRISAANSLSDIYAMGGTPFMALNIAALPPDLDIHISSQILKGGAEIAKKAGVVIAGGHTVQDEEPKYGLVVAGFVDLDKMFTKAGAKAGDLLYMTKPIGFGAITTALKQQKADQADVDEAVKWMTTLNDYASQAGRAAGVHGATDVTGYSLMGHAVEMAQASKVGLHFELAKIPVLNNAQKYADQMIFPGGAFDNRHHYEQFVSFECAISETQKMLLFDPQTSGGLLLAVPAMNSPVFEAEMRKMDQPFWQVGHITSGEGIRIY